MNTEKVITYNQLSYTALSNEMKDILQMKVELSQWEKEVRPKLIEVSGGERVENGIKIQLVKSKGTIDYKALVEYLGIDEQVIESFRKPESECWKITSY